MTRRTKRWYKNITLKKKMLLIYFIFAGLFFAVAILAFQISTDTFERKLYETSLKELDYYVQSVKENLEEIENRSYELAMDTEVQGLFSELKQLGPAVLEYNRLLTDLRWRLTNSGASRDVIRTIQYRDTYGSIVEYGTASWEIPEEVQDRFINMLKASDGEAIFYGPTEECRYLLCGRRIMKWTDMSLEELGYVMLVCDVEQIIARNKERLESDQASLFVYSGDTMIYQDLEGDVPKLPKYSSGQGYRILKYQKERYFMCYLSSSDMKWTYVNFFPYSDIYGQVTRVKYAAFLCFFAVFITLILLMNQMAVAITKPLEVLTRSMRVVETGDFQKAKLIPLDSDRKDEVGLLTQEFQIMLDKIDILIRENYEKQLLLKDTKYKMLQAQINPHFLYNTLNAIHWMIRAKKNEDAGRMIVELGTLLRASFNENLNITVEEELGMLKSYLEIQRFRYEDRAEFTVSIEGNPGQYIMPRMTLQPLVENAIFYGADVMAQFCRISIRVAEEKESILFEVTDNGPGIKEDELEKVRNFTVTPKRHGIGIRNIYERLGILYDTFRFTIDSREGQGTQVQIQVPKKNVQE